MVIFLIERSYHLKDWLNTISYSHISYLVLWRSKLILVNIDIKTREKKCKEIKKEAKKVEVKREDQKKKKNMWMKEWNEWMIDDGIEWRKKEMTVPNNWTKEDNRWIQRGNKL